MWMNVDECGKELLIIFVVFVVGFVYVFFVNKFLYVLFVFKHLVILKDDNFKSIAASTALDHSLIKLLFMSF
jgi:hypothetical protein